MSRTGSALLAKLAMTLVFSWVTLGLIDRNPLIWVAPIALAITVVNYAVGDLLVLPATGNVGASMVDGVTAALIAFVAGLIVPQILVTTPSLIVLALLVAAGEFYFHQYLLQYDEVEP